VGKLKGVPQRKNMLGTIADDVLTGTDGADWLNGGMGSDNIAGGGGADILEGGDGNDVLFSHGRTSDMIDPYYPNLDAVSDDRFTDVDTLRGGAGDDYLFAGYGDNVDGGEQGDFGNRLYINFSGATSGVVADFSRLQTETSITIGGGVITNIQNVSYILGSAFDDYLVGLDTFYPSGDAIFGGDGNDTIVGTYYSGWADGSLHGGNGDDLIDATASQYGGNAYGDAGNDVIRMNLDGTAYGGDGDDQIYSASVAYGDAGNDLIVMNPYTWGGGFADGGAGNDDLRVASGGGILIGGDGADRLTGGAGSDSLYSASLNVDGPSHDMGREVDNLSGGDDTDTIWAGYGDSADGGEGEDYLAYSFGGAQEAINISTSIFQTSSIVIGGGTIQNFEGLIRLRGSEFGDTINAAAQIGQLTIDAGAGNDVVTTNGNVFMVMGGSGNDMLISSTSPDMFDGGEGVDTVSYVQATSGIVISLGYFGGGGSGVDWLKDVENLNGSRFNDEMTGNEVDNQINGGSGDDEIYGREGNDTLIGAEGADYLDGGDGNDVLDGGDGLDTLIGGRGDDLYLDRDGTDVIVEAAAEGIDTLSTYASTYTLGANLDKLYFIGTGNFRGVGNDLDNDVSSISSDGDDWLSGLGGDDNLFAGAGNDLLDGGVGADRMFGGLGNDTFVVDAIGDQAIEFAAEGFDTVNASISYTLSANVESLRFIRAKGAVDGHGNAGNNWLNAAWVDVAPAASTQIRLYGEGGDDNLLGSRYGDLLDGGTGIDLMTGGYGNDRYVVDNAGDVVIEQAGQGFDTVDASVSYTLGANVEALRLMGVTGAVDAHGNAGNNWLNAVWVDVAPAAGTQIRLYGEGGNDDLQGSRYGDLLDGGTGADRMTGGLGNDSYVVDNAGDIVVEQAGAGYDVVTSSIGYALGDNVEALRLVSVAAGASVVAQGNDLNNELNAVWVDQQAKISLLGEGGNDRLLGSRYDDLLDGGTGADTMRGGRGNDSYVVDRVGDLVYEQAGEGYDVITSSVGYKLGANVEGLRLVGVAAGATVVAQGNDLNNSLNAVWVDKSASISLLGHGGDDTLLGSRFGDLLDGGAGSDTLTGGGGADRFHFGDVLDAATNVDTILDFQAGSDVIELDDAVFAGLDLGALDAGAFVANASGVATSADQRIIYDTDSGQLFYDADGSLGGAAVLFGVVAGHPPLTGADFVVV